MSSEGGAKAHEQSDAIKSLAEKAGARWQNIEVARERTIQTREGFRQKLEGLDGEDTSIVVFGSLARDEQTAISDTDWTLLVDGMVDPMHLTTAQEIERRIAAIGGKKPGQEGTFGSLAFSHQIVHWIGGEDDSNANTTRRVLLLLESHAIGRDEAWGRVIKNVLSRYLTEDHGLWVKGKDRRVSSSMLRAYWPASVASRTSARMTGSLFPILAILKY